MRKNMFDNPMNLQLFAMSEEELQAKLEELLGAEQQSEPVQESEAQELNQEPATQEPVAEPPVTEPVAQEPAGQPQSGPASSVVEKLHQIGVTKFNNEDDFVKSYVEMEKMNTRTRQELSELKNQIGQLMQVINQQKETSQPAAEEIADNENFLELFYENPKQALRQVLMETVKPELDTVVQKVTSFEKERTWRQQVDDFAATHPDLEQWAQDMGEILMENPELRDHPKGLEIAYNMAKGRKYQPVNPMQFLQDEQFISENILKNENIRKRIIEDYLQSLKKGNPPVNLGKTTGNDIPATVPKKPTTLDEATEMALKMLEKG